MIRLLIAFLLLTTGALAQQNDGKVRHVHMEGGCRAKAQKALAILYAAPAAPAFDIWFICNDVAWSRVKAKHKVTKNVESYSVVEKNLIVIHESALDDPRLADILNHELEHQRCHCDLGEKLN